MANYFTLVAVWGVLPVGNGLLNDAAFQIISKQWMVQGQAKKTEKSDSGSAPDEPACEARTLTHQILSYTWPPCWRRWNTSLGHFVNSS